MSNETDLDWLARNVHVWHEGANYVCVDHTDGGYVFHEHNRNCAIWFTKQQWLARRAELQSVTEQFKQSIEEANRLAKEFKAFTSIEDNQERQMKQDNGWYERGDLPPVGIAVQLWHGGTYAYDCELIAKRGNDFVLWNLTWDRPDSADCMMCIFKPTPTERELLADLIESHRQMSALDVADAILAAGFKRDGG